MIRARNMEKPESINMNYMLNSNGVQQQEQQQQYYYIIIIIKQLE